MNYLKLFGALLVLLCATAVGYFISYREKQKLNLLKAVLSFLAALENNIRYYRGDAVSLLCMSAPKIPTENINSRDEFADSFLGRFSLGDEQYSAFREFTAGFGTMDAQGEIERIRLCKGVFEEKYNNSLEEYKIKSRLYRSLGFFAGAALALMLV